MWGRIGVDELLCNPIPEDTFEYWIQSCNKRFTQWARYRIFWSVRVYGSTLKDTKSIRKSTAPLWSRDSWEEDRMVTALWV